MKKKIFALLSICLVFISSILALSGCAVSLKTGPSKNDAVTGNGSLSVRKGDYLYFVNGYVSNSSLENKDNNYGNVTDGAIYRAKLDNGQLMYDITIDENENETKTLKNVELVVPKVAGFEYTSLYIFDETLYFSSPTIEKDAEGTIRFDLTDIYAVGINGGRITQIAKALNFSSKDNFNFTQIDGKVYLTYLSDGALYNIKLNGKKVEDKNLISSSVTSFVLSSDNSEGGMFVYYTRGFNEDEHSTNGNVLAKTDLTTNKETILYRDNKNTYAVKLVKNDKIYYTYTNSLTTNAYVYCKSLTNFSLKEEEQLTYTVITNPIIVSLYDDSGVIDVQDSKLLFIKGTKNPSTDIVVLSEEKMTVVGVYGEYVYCVNSSNELNRINLQTNTLEALSSGAIYLDAKVNFDYESGYVYYFVKYTGNDSKEAYYLNRLELSSDAESEFVGVKSESFV